VFAKDVRKFVFKEKFDNAMAMFNIVGYQTKNEDLEKMFKNVYHSLKKGGIFVFDCWYMPAVLKDKPTDRIRKIKTHVGNIIRLTKSALNLNKDIIEISFDVIETVKDRVVNETNETHFMRYWSLPELQYFLGKAGFSVIRTCNFMDPNSEISDDEWNIFVVARKDK
jgi:SAM-dependent methyltransferase